MSARIWTQLQVNDSGVLLGVAVQWSGGRGVPIVVASSIGHALALAVLAVRDGMEDSNA